MRYERQIPIVGAEGQKKIMRSKVAVIGLGGLGCNVITHLASAGVGRFVLADDQSVEESNLNRQFVYSEKDIGAKKTERSAEWTRRLNPGAKIVQLDLEINDRTARLIGKCDVIVDCTDNYDARIAINRYAIKNNIKLVHGGVSSLYGQVFVVVPFETPCLECILPRTTEKNVPSISPMVGTIGSVQAAESLKLLSGTGSPLSGKLLTMDASSNDYRITEIKRRDGCPGCSAKI